LSLFFQSFVHWQALNSSQVKTGITPLVANDAGSRNFIQVLKRKACPLPLYNPQASKVGGTLYPLLLGGAARFSSGKTILQQVGVSNAVTLTPHCTLVTVQAA